ncbi:hypothetical protein [Commensalibacter papalotli (ex Botero et al. 2024)]|nr:hypothetical protein [Commensalibacter papalotli (ex Botero et al. 2024)]CAI3950106.1 unnamed protein product [Commensalibacter papalotli (ex Botero et al. 2024)]
MNYFLRKLGLKEDRISIGLNRLSIALILWLWMALIIRLLVYQYRYFLITEICIITIFIYLFFMVLVLSISIIRYGCFRQVAIVKRDQFSKRKINLFYFFSLKQMGIKANPFFYVLQGLGIGCAGIIQIPFIFWILSTCYECFRDMDNLSEDEMKMWVGIQDIGTVTRPSEAIYEVGFMLMLGLFIYFSFILGMWILSGFIYGKIKND